MNTRTTWILVFVALAMGAALWTSNRKPGQTVGSRGGASVSFAAPRPEDVVRLEVQRSNVLVKVTRTDLGWMLLAPVQYVAQPTGIENLLTALAKLAPVDFIPGKQVAAQPGGLAAFGLDQPATVTLEMRGGKPMVLRLGGPTPLEGQFYLQVAGTDGVFVADSKLLAAIPSSVDGWRDRGLFDLRHTPFDRLELQQRGKTVFEAVTDGQTWRLTKPLSARASTEALATLVDQLQTARVSEFVTDGPLVNPEAFGLQPPEAELVIGRGSNDLVRLQFGGNPTNALDKQFVQRVLQTNLVLVSSSNTFLTSRPLHTFRDRQLLGALLNISSIDFRGGDRTTGGTLDRFSVRREGTNWFVIEPRRFPADYVQIEKLFQDLESLEIEEFTADVIDNPARFGLDMPTMEYSLGITAVTNGVATNIPVFNVQFGGVPTNNPHLVHARRSDEPGVYSIVRAGLVRLPESGNQLRDWRFSVSNVVSVTVVRSNVVRELTRTSDGHWNVTRGAAANLIPDALDETLYRLGNYNPFRYAVRDEKVILQSGGYGPTAHEMLVQFREGSGVLRRLRIRFGREIPPLVPALLNFDDDPSAVQVRFPVAIYRDVLRDFNAP